MPAIFELVANVVPYRYFRSDGVDYSTEFRWQTVAVRHKHGVRPVWSDKCIRYAHSGSVLLVSVYASRIYISEVWRRLLNFFTDKFSFTKIKCTGMEFGKNCRHIEIYFTRDRCIAECTQCAFSGIRMKANCRFYRVKAKFYAFRYVYFHICKANVLGSCRVMRP